MRYDIKRLKEIWADATDIERGVCHCGKRALMLSFVLPTCRAREHADNTKEHCGYWCTGCNFSNAGSRVILKTAAEE